MLLTIILISFIIIAVAMNLLMVCVRYIAGKVLDKAIAKLDTGNIH